MKLAEFRASYPLFELQSEVTFQTPRAPTVVERMILRLIVTATAAIGDMTLADAFTDVLGMGDARRVLKTFIDPLFVLDVVLYPHGEDPLEIPIRRLSLTKSGLAFWERNLLPGAPQTKRVAHTYDFITDTLKPQSTGKLVRADNARPADEIFLDQPLRTSDLEARLREGLVPGSQAWITHTTEIGEVHNSAVSTSWRSVELRLDCKEDGVLSLHAPHDNAFRLWLQASDPQRLWTQIIEPALGIAKDAPTPENRWHLPDTSCRQHLDLRQAKGVQLLARASEAPTTTPSTTGILMLSRMFAPDAPPGDWVRLEDDKPSSAPIDFSRQWQAPQAAGSPLLSLPLTPYFPAGFTHLTLASPGKVPDVRLEGAADLVWAGQAYRVPLELTLAEEPTGIFWRDCCNDMDTALLPRPQAALLPAMLWWQPPAFVVAQWLTCCDGLRPDEWIRQLVEFLAALRRRLALTAITPQSSWAQDLAEAAALVVAEAESPLDLPDLITWLDLLQGVELARPRLQQIVLESAEQVHTLKDLQSIRQSLADERMALPLHLIGNGARQALIEGTLAPSDQPKVGLHAASATLAGLKQVYATANDLLGGALSAPSALRPGTAYSKARRQATATYKVLDNLRSSMADVGEALELGDQANALAFGKTREQLRHFEQWMDTQLAPAEGPASRPVVMDTNTLIEFSSIFERLARHDFAVVPKRVVQELDHLKTRLDDPSGKHAYKVREAMRSVDNAPQARHQASKPELLALDWTSTPDNDILSVALFYSRSPVILLTRDKNLRIKASAEGIRAMSGEEYLREFGQVIPAHTTMAPASAS